MLLIEFHDFAATLTKVLLTLPIKATLWMASSKRPGAAIPSALLTVTATPTIIDKAVQRRQAPLRQDSQEFQQPHRQKGVTAYLEKHIDSDKVRTVMNKFLLPGNAETSLTALSWALSEQLQIIIHEPDNHVDVVAAEYQRYLTKTVDTLSAPFQPLYDGDSYWNQSDRSSTYKLDFYEKLLTNG